MYLDSNDKVMSYSVADLLITSYSLARIDIRIFDTRINIRMSLYFVRGLINAFKNHAQLLLLLEIFFP